MQLTVARWGIEGGRETDCETGPNSMEDVNSPGLPSSATHGHVTTLTHYRYSLG